MSSNIIPLYFLAQTLYSCTFSSKAVQKCKFLRFSSAWVKIREIRHVSYELTNQFLFKFSIIPYCMTHNSPVNFNLIHFLLWIKGFHQSPNFEIFECSSENLRNSSRHFLKYNSVFLQILHQYLVISNITPMYICISNIIPGDIHLDEDVLKTSFVFIFRGHLDQYEYMFLTQTSSEDVFQMSSSCLQDVFKMSWSRTI